VNDLSIALHISPLDQTDHFAPSSVQTTREPDSHEPDLPPHNQGLTLHSAIDPARVKLLDPASTAGSAESSEMNALPCKNPLVNLLTSTFSCAELSTCFSHSTNRFACAEASFVNPSASRSAIIQSEWRLMASDKRLSLSASESLNCPDYLWFRLCSKQQV
jgi:hypothetical protein